MQSLVALAWSRPPRVQDAADKAALQTKKKERAEMEDAERAKIKKAAESAKEEQRRRLAELAKKDQQRAMAAPVVPVA